jgi:hypothetical protein
MIGCLQLFFSRHRAATCRPVVAEVDESIALRWRSPSVAAEADDPNTVSMGTWHA